MIPLPGWAINCIKTRSTSPSVCIASSKKTARIRGSEPPIVHIELRRSRLPLAITDDSSIDDLNQAVKQFQPARIVGHHADRHGLLVDELAKDPHHLPTARTVETGGRLI